MRLSRGTTRYVILTRRWAIKIPRPTEWRLFLRGLLANQQEAMWWRETRDPRLCPVVACVWGGWLVVMPRAEPVTEDECDALGDEHWSGVPFESKVINFGRLRGSVVNLDYGG